MRMETIIAQMETGVRVVVLTTNASLYDLIGVALTYYQASGI